MTTSPAVPRSALRAGVSALRPRQWIKNVVIAAVPAATGTLSRPAVLGHTIATAVAFCAVASGLYVLNDLHDAEADRHHPIKRHRAIAAGQLRDRPAIVLATLLVLAGAAVTFFVPRPTGVWIVLGSYVAVSLAYTRWLKSVPVVELVAVASGYVLRAEAGAEASHLAASPWILVVVSFGALFLIVAKRDVELRQVGTGRTRAVLASYTRRFLDSALATCATVVVAAYCAWAVEAGSGRPASNHGAVLATRLSAVPIVAVVLVVWRAVETGRYATPEGSAPSRRAVPVLLVLWAVLVAFGVYG